MAGFSVVAPEPPRPALPVGYGFAYTGGGCRPRRPPPGHAPQLALAMWRGNPSQLPDMRTSSAPGAASLRATRPLRSSLPDTRACPPKSPPLRRHRPAGPPSSHPREPGNVA
jgi:hypothetical protein